MTDIEQRRRNLKASDPDLYAYVSAVETQKALDSAGDSVSGISHEAANLVWQRAETAKARAAAARAKARSAMTTEGYDRI